MNCQEVAQWSWSRVSEVLTTEMKWNEIPGSVRKPGEDFMAFHGISRRFTTFHDLSWHFLTFHAISLCFIMFHYISPGFTMKVREMSGSGEFCPIRTAITFDHTVWTFPHPWSWSTTCVWPLLILNAVNDTNGKERKVMDECFAGEENCRLLSLPEGDFNGSKCEYYLVIIL